MSAEEKEGSLDILRSVDREKLERFVIFVAKYITREIEAGIINERDLASSYISSGESSKSFEARARALEIETQVEAFDKLFRRTLKIERTTLAPRRKPVIEK